MTLFPRVSAVLAAFSLAPCLSGEIDSGGGATSGGGLKSHASIGALFATAPATSGAPINHPGLIEVLYPITPSSISDFDANELPDGWEMGNFGAIGVDPDADADNDGTSNRMEFLAGTDPRNATSVFRPQGTFTNGVFHMPVQTVTGRTYQVWVSRNLSDWTLHETLTGDGSVKNYEFDETTITSGPLHSPTHPSKYFFRIQILIP